MHARRFAALAALFLLAGCNYRDYAVFTAEAHDRYEAAVLRRGAERIAAHRVVSEVRYTRHRKIRRKRSK